jgi:hypothetical protein
MFGHFIYQVDIVVAEKTPLMGCEKFQRGKSLRCFGIKPNL